MFVVLVESIFGIDNIRLTKDPGYRHVGRSNLGESVVVVVVVFVVGVIVHSNEKLKNKHHLF